MKSSFCLLFLAITFIVLSSISTNEVKNPLIGGWELTNWTVGLPVNLIDTNEFTTNLLDQTSCDVKEVLTFDNNGIVTSENTFGPKITIRLKEGTSDVFMFEEICGEGQIGYAAQYVGDSNGNVQFNNIVGVVVDRQLTVIYKDAIKIYNETLTEVVESKDLTLVYTKKG